MAGLEVETPLGHVDHAAVVGDQQGEGDDAKGVDVVAALHGRLRWLVMTEPDWAAALAATSAK